uniref:Uncharacterized protein n=1 Tax=Anguilla anguilla TaxID=7936 RepID=A0A0E9Q9W8_ANGAN
MKSTFCSLTCNTRNTLMYIPYQWQARTWLQFTHH